MDHDNDGDLDLSLSNRNEPSMIFTTFSSFLKPTMDEIGAQSASSVAWGNDAGSGSNYLDLLFGADKNGMNARLCRNRGGYFLDSACYLYMSNGQGPHSVAFGDVNGDNDLDLVFGGVAAIQVYLAGDTSDEWIVFTPTHSVAWGDADDDGDLDLLAIDSNAATIDLFVNQGGSGVNLEHTWSLASIAADAPYGLDESSNLPAPSPRIQLTATTPYNTCYLPSS